MVGQRHWEDVREGEDVEPLLKVATTQMLVRFAGASGDFSPHHYDDHLAKSWFPEKGIIVHGALKAAWLGQFITRWAGDEGGPARVSRRDPGYRRASRGGRRRQGDHGGSWPLCPGRRGDDDPSSET